MVILHLIKEGELSVTGESMCTVIGIKHRFSYINIRQVPWEVLKTEAKTRGRGKGPGECYCIEKPCSITIIA